LANKDKLLESAQKFLAKGQVARAIGEYQQLIDAFPRDYRNRQKLAELLCRERRFDEALAHFEAVARNFAEMGFYLKAIAIYKQMQKIDPSRADTYLRVAELNEQHGLIGNALSEYHHLMAFYDRHGMLREAAAVLQKMSCLEPDNGGLRSRLIETLALPARRRQRANSCAPCSECWTTRAIMPASSSCIRSFPTSPCQMSPATYLWRAHCWPAVRWTRLCRCSIVCACRSRRSLNCC